MKKTLLFIILFFSLFIFFSSSSFAANYYVSTTGSNDAGDGSVGNPWRTITYAITLMTTGDILNINNGTYNAALGETFPINMGADKHLKAVNTGLATVEGSSSNHVIQGTYYATVEGLYITGNGSGYYDIYVANNAHIKNCTLSDDNGGGIWIESSGSVEGTSVSITNANANSDALIYLTGSNTEVKGCSVSIVTSGDTGIYMGAGLSGVMVRDSTITSNASDYKYGISSLWSTTATINNCTIEGKASGYDSGGYGVFVSGYTGSGLITVSSSEIRGFYTGIRCGNKVTVDHCTVVRGYTGIENTGSGGATDLTVTNSIIAADGKLNAHPSAGTGVAISTNNYNDVFGYLNNYTDGTTIGNNSIVKCPRFVDFDNNDFRLYSGSACLSAASDGSDIGRWQGAGEAGSSYNAAKYVSGSGDDGNNGNTVDTPYRTVKKATQYALDTIYVAGGGTYNAAGGDDTFPLYLNNNRHMVLNGSGLATIEGAGSNHVIQGGDYCTVEGLSITGNGSGTYYDVYLVDNGRIKDCILSDNNGAGIRVDANGSVEGTTVSITDSNSSNQAAIDLYGSNTEVKGCSVSIGTSGDTGIYLTGSLSGVMVRNSTITSNASDYKYGIMAQPSTTATINNCTLEGKTSGYDSGGYGVYVSGYTGSGLITISSSEIRGFYNGIHCVNVVTVDHCAIVRNYNGITKNESVTAGNLNITNSIIAADGKLNAHPSAGTGVAISTNNYNDVFGYLTNYTDGTTIGNNSIVKCPRFVDFDNNDFRLYSGSACLSAASDGSDIGRWQGAGEAGGSYNAAKYVSGSGDDGNNGNTVDTPYRTVKKATQYALDTIYVAGGGTYNAAGGDDTFPLYLNNNRHMVLNGSGLATIEGAGSNHVIQGGDYCTVEGLSITGNGSGTYYDVYLVDNGRIKDCILSDNNGAGIRVDANGSVEGTTVSITDSNSSNQAAIDLYGSNTEVKGCSVSIGTSGDTGIYLTGSLSGVMVRNSTITSNASDYKYGIMAQPSTTATINNCTLEGKTSGYDSGGYGVYVSGYTGSGLITVSSSEIRGFYTGIDCRNKVTVNHCTVVRGYTGINNGGSGGATDLTVTNSIVSSHEGNGLYTAMTNSYNDVWGNGTNYANGAVTGDGDISSNPLFTDYANNNFHLQGTSPCIDTGDPTMFDPDGTRTDMGMYYYVQSITKLAFTTSAQTLVVGQTSEVITVQTQSDISHAMNVTGNKTIDLTSTSGNGHFYSDASGATQITLATIESGTSSKNFYYKDTTVGAPTVTAAENPSEGWTNATQEETITAGIAAYLKITGTSTIAAGTNDELTITAYDEYNNVAVDYIDIKNLTFSGPSMSPSGNRPKVEGTNIGQPTSISFVDGTSEANAATLVAYLAESVSLNVTDGTITSTGDASRALNLVVSATTESYLTLTGTDTMTAGGNNELTVTAWDAYGNIATGYNPVQNLVFSGLNTSSLGNIPTVEGVNFGSAVVTLFDGGVSMVGALTLTAYSAEVKSVDVTDGTITTTGEASYDLDLTVNPGSSNNLNFSTQPSTTATAGVNFVTQPKVEVRDAYGNRNTNDSTSSVYLKAVLDSDNNTPGHGTLGATANPVTVSSGLGTFAGVNYNYAESIDLVATVEGLTVATSDTVAVSAGTKNKLLWFAQPSNSVGAGATWDAFSIEITDMYGNRTADTDNIIVSASSGSLNGTVLQAAVAGLVTFNAVSYNTAGTITVKGTGEGLTDSADSNAVAVGAAAAAYLKVTGTATVTAGANDELTITAYDAYNNISTGYTGGKSLKFSGPNNSPDGNVPKVEGTNIGSATSINFTSGTSDANVSTLVAYKVEGATVNVTDEAAGAGSSIDSSYGLALTVNPGSSNYLKFSSQPSATGTAGATLEVQPTIEARDAYGNRNTNDNTSQVYLKAVLSSDNSTPGHGTLNATTNPLTMSSGLASFGGVRYNYSESIDLVGTVEGLTVATSDAVVIGGAAASYLSITSEGGTVVAGANKTIVLTAYDAYDNISTAYTGAKSLTFSGLSNSPNSTVPKVDTTNLGSATSITFSSGGASGVLAAYKEEFSTLEATDGTINTTNHALSLTVSSGAISSLTLEAAAAQISGTAFISTIEALDAYGNRTTSGLTGGAALTIAPITTLSNIISPAAISQTDISTGIWTGNLTITATGSGTSIVTAECSSKTGNKIFTLSDLTPPDAPSNAAVTKEAAGAALYISWTNPVKASLSGYVVRYSNSSYPATHTDGTLATEGAAAPSSSTAYKHTGLTNDTKYYYSIFGYDAAGNYSSGTNLLGTPEASGGTGTATVEFRSSIQGTTLITGDAVDASQVVALVRDSSVSVSSLSIGAKATYSDPTLYVDDQVVPSSDYTLEITTELKSGELQTYFTFKLKSPMSEGAHSIKFTVKNSAGQTIEGQVNGLKVKAGSVVATAPLFYPNPANPDRDTMMFAYELSGNVGVEIYLFDPSGRQVYKKVCEAQTMGGTAGYNEVRFDGKNDFGEVLGNGVYFAYIVESASKRKIGKIKVAIYR